MKSSPNSTGNSRKSISESNPYILTIASQQGGSGRSTLASALAWIWGQSGKKVILVDADATHAATMIAARSDGDCVWKNVTLVKQFPNMNRIAPQADIVVMDAPRLSDSEAQSVLQHTHGVLLTLTAQLIALRTLSKATRAIQLASQTNGDLELLGIALNIYDCQDEAQTRVLAELQSMEESLLVGSTIPQDGLLRDWPLNPGSALPTGPGQGALTKLAELLMPRMQRPVQKVALVGGGR